MCPIGKVLIFLDSYEIHFFKSYFKIQLHFEKKVRILEKNSDLFRKF